MANTNGPQGPTFNTLAGALRWALGRILDRGDYWQHAEGILNAADMSHQPAAWQERQQRSATEWGPWYHCIRMRRPDEPLAATVGGIGYQWRPLFAHEEPAAIGTAAVRTLERIGYTWRGGELWAPPVGRPSESYVIPPELVERLCGLPCVIERTGAPGVVRLVSNGRTVGVLNVASDRL